MPSDPTETSEMREPFERWLAERWPDVKDLRVHEFGAPPTGYSAKTLITPISFERDGEQREEKVVFRVENPGPPIYPPQAPGLDVEIDIQYRTMEAVSRTGKIPLAELIGYEADPSWVGSPFFAMEYIEGEVPVLDPMYTRAGFFFDTTPENRRRLIENGLRLLAELHTIDYRAIGLDWLIAPATEPDVSRQLDIWEDWSRAALRDRVHPEVERGYAWLRANVPTGLTPGLSWGDARPGNIIWRDFEAVCVTDWENVAIAPPEYDLGWWLMFDQTCRETPDDRLPGDPSLDEQRDFYCEVSGRDVGDVGWFVIQSAVRYIGIVSCVMNRMVDMGQLPADHEVWLHNPPATLATRLLDEVGA